MSQAAEIIKKHDLRVTKARVNIIKALLKAQKPLSVEDLTANMDCDNATLFRSVNQLVEAGVLNALHLGFDRKYYEIRDDEHHHHHAICTSCNQINRIDTCSLKPMFEEMRSKNFQVTSHQVKFFGICQACQS